MKAPGRISLLRGRRLRQLRLLNRRFQARALGEEMARVNLNLTPAERLAYTTSMRNLARLKGVRPQPSYSVAWLLKVEEEVLKELAEKP